MTPAERTAAEPRRDYQLTCKACRRFSTVDMAALVKHGDRCGQPAKRRAKGRRRRRKRQGVNRG